MSAYDPKRTSLSTRVRLGKRLLCRGAFKLRISPRGAFPIWKRTHNSKAAGHTKTDGFAFTLAVTALVRANTDTQGYLANVPTGFSVSSVGGEINDVKRRAAVGGLKVSFSSDTSGDDDSGEDSRRSSGDDSGDDDSRSSDDGSSDGDGRTTLRPGLCCWLRLRQ